MNELAIKVNYESDNPTVSGRELHEKLGIRAAYKDWFPRMCEYGFAEGEDFNPLKNEQVRGEGGREVTPNGQIYFIDKLIAENFAEEAEEKGA